MKIGLDIKGTDKVIQDLKKFGRAGRREIAEETLNSAFLIMDEAKRTAPFRFGKLRQSIIAEKLTRFVWTVTAYESYASFVEFGTVKMAARPFLRPAWKKQIKIYRRDLNTALQRVANKFNK